MAIYLAYRCGKGNQNFVLKTENYETVMEANLLKRKIFGASDFEFVDAKTNTKVAHKVGHTVTKRVGTGVGSSSTIGIAYDSSFSFDKERIFDALAKKGYRVKLTDHSLTHPALSLFNGSNQVVATFKLNVNGPRQENVSGIGKTQKNTVIETNLENLEGVFLAAFMLSRVQMSTKLM